MAFLACQGMPTAAGSIRREHAEAFIAAELECTTPSSAATHYRSLQQLFGWLDEEDEIHRSPMAAMRPLKIPDSRPPSFPMKMRGTCRPTVQARTSATGQIWPSSSGLTRQRCLACSSTPHRRYHHGLRPLAPIGQAQWHRRLGIAAGEPCCQRGSCASATVQQASAL